MTPQDLDFAATEHCHVDIIPAVKMDRLQMIKAEYGPFRPQIRCTVPLWLALTMRASGHCRVVPPDWLSIGTCSPECLTTHMAQTWMCVENLTNVLKCEKERPEEFAHGLDARYLEIFVALQRACPEDLLPELPELQRLVQCIREVRQQKIIYGLSSLDGTALFVPFIYIFTSLYILLIS